MKIVIYSCPSDDFIATFGNGRIRPHLGESPSVNPLQKRRQGENHLSPQVGKSPPEMKPFPFRHTREKDREEGYRKD